MGGELDKVQKNVFLCRWESGQNEEVMEVEEGDGGVVDQEGFDARKLRHLWSHKEVRHDVKLR